MGPAQCSGQLAGILCAPTHDGEQKHRNRAPPAHLAGTTPPDRTRVASHLGGCVRLRASAMAILASELWSVRRGHGRTLDSRLLCPGIRSKPVV